MARLPKPLRGLKNHCLRVVHKSSADALSTSLVAGTPAQINDGDALRPVRNLQPLRGATRLRGVLETRLPTLQPSDDLNRQNLLSTVAELMAAALERLHYLDVAARTQSEIEAERLRNSLLATLSGRLDWSQVIATARPWVEGVRRAPARSGSSGCPPRSNRLPPYTAP